MFCLLNTKYSGLILPHGALKFVARFRDTKENTLFLATKNIPLSVQVFIRIQYFFIFKARWLAGVCVYVWVGGKIWVQG